MSCFSRSKMDNMLIGDEKNLLFYNDEELDENSTCVKIAQVQKEGDCDVKREYIYKLDMTISIPFCNYEKYCYWNSI